MPFMDGLRGLAAFLVVLHHFTLAFAPPFAEISAKMSQLAKIGYEIPVGLLIVSGDFAVSIFFVISGFVLSYKFFTTQQPQVAISGAIRRYFRLMPTVLVTALLSYLILATGHYYNIPAAKITGSVHWLAASWIGPAHFWVAVKLALFDAFFTGRNILTYNNVLWTMQIEFWGSMLVFAFLAMFGKLRWRGLVYLVLALALLDTYYFAFILGLILSDLAVHEHQMERRLAHPYFGILALAFGLVFGLAPQAAICVHVAGAALVLSSILLIPQLRSLLSMGPFKYLGRVSFALYLVHLSVLASLGCLVFLWCYPHVGYLYSVVAGFIASMLVTFPLAELLTRYVDTPAVRRSGRLYRYIRVKVQLARRSPTPVIAPSPTGS